MPRTRFALHLLAILLLAAGVLVGGYARSRLDPAAVAAEFREVVRATPTATVYAVGTAARGTVTAGLDPDTVAAVAGLVPADGRLVRTSSAGLMATSDTYYMQFYPQTPGAGFAQVTVHADGLTLSLDGTQFTVTDPDRAALAAVRVRLAALVAASAPAAPPLVQLGK